MKKMMIIIIIMMSMTILRRIQGERGKGGYAPGESSWIFCAWKAMMCPSVTLLLMQCRFMSVAKLKVMKASQSKLG